MKNLLKIVLVLFLLVTIPVSFSTAGTAEATGVKWYPYEVGMEKMKAEGKIGFLHFYTDWCTYCKLMNSQTFSDKRVFNYLNENFIPIRINAEQEKQVAQKYGVDRFPSNWFISKDGQNLANRPGFIPPDLMYVMLKYLHTGSYKTTNFQDYLDGQK